MGDRTGRGHSRLGLALLLLLASCGLLDPNSLPEALFGTWELVAINGSPVSFSGQMEFHDDGICLRTMGTSVWECSYVVQGKSAEVRYANNTSLVARVDGRQLTLEIPCDAWAIMCSHYWEDYVRRGH